MQKAILCQETAFQAVHKAANLFRSSSDSSLDKETELLLKLESTLALLSGHMGEAVIEENLNRLGNKIPRELLGVWKVRKAPKDSDLFDKDTLIAFWPAGGVSIFQRHKRHDYLQGDLLYKASGIQSFQLHANEDNLLDNDYEDVSFEYSIKSKTLTLKVPDQGEFNLKPDRIRLNPESDNIDPLFGLPKR